MYKLTGKRTLTTEMALQCDVFVNQEKREKRVWTGTNKKRHSGCFKDQFVFRRPLEFTMKQKKEVIPSRDYAAKNTAVWEGWILSQLSDDTKLFIREKLQSRQEVAGGRRSVDHDD